MCEVVYELPTPQCRVLYSCLARSVHCRAQLVRVHKQRRLGYWPSIVLSDFSAVSVQRIGEAVRLAAEERLPHIYLYIYMDEGSGVPICICL